jgi:hypothetical protein
VVLVLHVDEAATDRPERLDLAGDRVCAHGEAPVCVGDVDRGHAVGRELNVAADQVELADVPPGEVRGFECLLDGHLVIEHGPEAVPCGLVGGEGGNALGDVQFVAHGVLPG